MSSDNRQSAHPSSECRRALQRRARVGASAVAGGFAAALVVAGSAAAVTVRPDTATQGLAAHPATSRPSATAESPVGTVSAVDAAKDTFTLKTSSGTSVTVTVTSSTAYKEGTSAATFADVKAGESVAVIGTGSSSAVTASVVIIGKASAGGGPGPGGGGFPGGGFPGGGTFGTVSSINSSNRSFVLKEASGSTVTVKVTKSTTYRDRSKSSAGFSDIKKGETVAVSGKTSSGTETATSVFILGTGGFGGRGFGGRGFGGTFGTVSSVDTSGHTFVLKEASGTTITVKVTKSTKYVDTSKSSATFADITKGETVAVSGKTTKGVETATIIRIGTFRPPTTTS